MSENQENINANEQTENTENQQNQEKQQSRRGAPQPIEMAKNIATVNKPLGIVVGIIMIIVGILILSTPIISFIAINYLATICFVIYGIYLIVSYFKTQKEKRDGWMIANGIIFLVLGILLLFSGIIETALTFGFILGFLAMFGGISQLASLGTVEHGKGWVIASGIINIILAIVMFSAPILGILAIEWIVSIYLIVGGISVLILALSYKKPKSA